MGGAVRWAGSIVSWTVLLASACALIALVLVPALTHAQTFTVLTGSMTPALRPGDLVVSREVAAEQLRLGDVVTYQLRSGEPEVVTHRIVGVGVDSNGERVFTTRGDANKDADAAPVRPIQIRGVLWYKIPLLGYVNAWMSGSWRALIITTAVIALAGYAVAMFALGTRDALRRRRGGEVRRRHGRVH